MFGRIIVIAFGLIVAILIAGIVLAIGIIAPDWPWLSDIHKTSNHGMECTFNCPIGSMLCISVTLNPLLRADSLPLKIPVGKVERPFA